MGVVSVTAVVVVFIEYIMCIIYVLYYCMICNYYSIILIYVTKYVHFNNEVFLEWSNGENLLRKILLLTIGNFYERSIDHRICTTFN